MIRHKNNFDDVNKKTCNNSSKRICESKASDCFNLKEILKYGSNEYPGNSDACELNKITEKSTKEENNYIKINEDYENEIFYYNRISDDNCSDALKTSNQSKNSDASEHKQFFAFFNFVEKTLFV